MVKCKNCGKENYTIIYKVGKNFCSYVCYEKFQRLHKTPNTKCEICEKPMYMKPFRLKRVINGITCSKQCTHILKARYMSGEKNHQYGLKGDKNSSFKGVVTKKHGYNMLYIPNHPRADKDGRYREHRHIVEQCLDIDDLFFDIINNTRVLKEEYDVHHINENRSDNRISNLLVLTRREHTSLHNKQKFLLRNNKGQIIGVIKSDELLETPEEDNQQPI